MNVMSMAVACALVFLCGLIVFIAGKAGVFDPLVRLIRTYMRLPVSARIFAALFVAWSVGAGGAKNPRSGAGPLHAPRRLLRPAASVSREELPTTDTNSIAFVQFSRDASTSNLLFTLYAPATCPIDVFGRVRLESGNWECLGTVNAVSPFTAVTVYSPSNSYFLAAARQDVDSDGDGIPDGRERFLFHTDPRLWDSSGDGLSDWAKVYLHGLDPLRRDSDGDGYDDDEEIAAGQSPYHFTVGAPSTIRYVYDDDDRLVGGYVGTSQGAATVTLTPAGNPAMLHERGAR